MRLLHSILAYVLFRSLVAGWKFLFGVQMRRLDGAE
jgi:hypothetical protein